MTFRIVRSDERWRVWTSARTGSPNAFRTAFGSSTARATTSRTTGSADPSVTGAQQSALNRSRSNMSMTSFSLRITGDAFRPGSNPIQNLILARHGPDCVRNKPQLEADQMPETHTGPTRQLEAIEEPERTLIANDLPRQEEIYFVM